MNTRISIFELENKLNIKEEFNRLHEILFSNKYQIKIGYTRGSFIGVINERIFPYWDGRDTILDVMDYLNFIGINNSIRMNGNGINETAFLNFLEFLANIDWFARNYCSSAKLDLYYNPKVHGCITNIRVLLSKMHCELIFRNKKYFIIKSNIDVDSVAGIVPESVFESLLAYCDFRIESNLDAKRKILKTIDLYIDSNKKQLSNNDGGKSLISDIDFIMNKMGINHKIDRAYEELDCDELLKWYDYTFVLSLELFRRDKIRDIRSEINSLKSSISSSR